MAQSTIITDGSANNMTGEGGWCAIVRTNSTATNVSLIVEVTGYASKTTSNRMEMMAAIGGLSELQTSQTIDLISDSAYLLNTLKNKWYIQWISDEEAWNASSKRKKSYPRPNMDLWKTLISLIEFHSVRFIKVKGHSGDYWNNRADKLAGIARKNKYGSRNWFPSFDNPLEGDFW